MNFGVIVTVIAAIIFLIAKGIYDYFSDKQRTLLRLKNQWGQYPDKEFASGKLESVKLYYENNVEENDVDDITWNDLDMDELYKMINHTESSMGEEVLYKILRKPLFDDDEIAHRKSIIGHFQNNEEDRTALQRKLTKIGSDRKLSFYEFFMRLDEVNTESNVIHYMLILAMTVFGVGMFFNSGICLAGLLSTVCISILLYYKRKAQIEAYYYILSSILKMLYSSADIAKLNISVIENELNDIKKYNKSFSGFKRGSQIVLQTSGGNLTDIIFDYIRMITHIDLIKFNNMYKHVMNNREMLLKLYYTVGYLDSMIAIASFRYYLSDRGWCEPEFVKERRIMEYEDAYHPFIDEPVYNSFSTESSILLTGSNASGKSTFLKMTAINAILAQTIVTVAAKKYIAPYYKVMTSMALSDNIFSSRSYFIVEIMSLKRILESNRNVNILCCIDEVLRGTNTVERIAASSQILKCLENNNVLCFAATHDVELSTILNEHYSNYHFQETISNENVLFDYKIYEGPSKTKNAIKLLNMLGYEKNLVKDAENMAEYFEKNNTWDRI